MNRAASTVIYTCLGLLAVGSFLPLIRTDVWWVRVLDFPRLQLFVGLAVMLMAAVLLGGRSALRVVLLASGLGALLLNAHTLAPYMPAASEVALAVAECPAERRLTVLVANVERDNRNAEALFERVAETRPDIFLAMETGPWWDRALDRLQPRFLHHVKQVAAVDTHFGIHLFSQLPLSAISLRRLPDHGVPWVTATATLPDGSKIELFGLHPRPPRPFESARHRDSQLLNAALQARASAVPTIVAGDLNAVPWEGTYRLMLRVGGLLDPRQGRGLYNTYNAELPGVAWPLDHIVWQNGLALLMMARVPPIGSDHFPYLGVLCHDSAFAGEQAPPAAIPDDLVRARRIVAAGMAP